MFSIENAEDLVTPPPAAVVWEADPETLQFTYVSRAAERLLGYSLEHWLMRQTFWIDLIHPEDRDAAVAACRTAIARCEDHEFEYRMIASDGRIIWVRDIVHVVCARDGSPAALRGAMVDVSDRWRVGRAPGDVHISSRRAADARLAGAIAHDINNVLFTISGTAGLALGAPRLPETRDALQAIERAASVGAALAARLLTLDESDDGRTLVDVPATIAQFEAWLREVMGFAVTVEVLLYPDSASVRLRKGQLEQLLLNLAVNARDAMLEGGRFRIGVWCDRSSRQTESPDVLVMEVSDSGSGIAPDLIDRIFDPNVTTKGSARPGLGLTTVAEIVRGASGTIAVRSRPGNGTAFVIKLPMQ